MPASVLLIEDDEDSLELLSLVLGSRGFAVTPVPSFDAAVRSLELHAYDLVLSDFLVDGTHVGDSWTKLDAVKDLAGPGRIGLLTAYPIAPDEWQRRGFRFHLVKPCPTDELFDQLAKTLALPVPDQQEVLVRDYFKALEQGDYDRLVSLCSPTVIYHLPRSPAPMPERVVGRTAFRAFAQATFDQFREPRFEVSRIRGLPSGALARYSGSWRDGESRRELPGAVLFSFVQNEISEIGIRCDLSVIG